MLKWCSFGKPIGITRRNIKPDQYLGFFNQILNIDYNPSLQIVFSQSRLSAQDSQGEPVGKYIESAHAILGQIEGHRTEDCSARNPVFRLNDILTRKENLS